ncbi:MAG: 50S ribosomal protein L13 [Candidatus Altimarinota bacterium]
MKTSIPKVLKEQDRKWYIVDAEGQVLGRLATRIADILRGKHRPTFTPHMDMGDHVVVINSSKIRVTGAKHDQKIYYSHSQYPGHLSLTTLKEMQKKKPGKIIEEAVRGMLPKNKLRDGFMQKLHVYEGTEHQHDAQKPEALAL